MTNQISSDIRRTTMKNLALEVGNRVIHVVTGLRGTVIGTAKFDGLYLLTVRFNDGRIASLLDRQEFRLCTGI
jgi:hypothetical protein